MSDEPRLGLGAYLKAERERRGLSIDQAASSTKIGLKILKLLEEDRYSELPALPFVRGFVRNYGKFLGIDGEQLLTDYAEFLEERSGQRPQRDAGHSGYAFERPEGEQSKKILWGVMAGMLVFGGAVVFLFKPALKHKRHGHVEKLKAVPTPTATPEEEDVPSGDDAEMAAAPEASESTTKPSPTATPTPSVTATPKPSPSPTPTAKPSPSPTTTPSTAPTPVPTPSPSVSLSPRVLTEAEDLEQDHLQSGLNYATQDVKHRVVFRAKDDVWVRYRCDDKKVMRFALKKDKVLVLRGKNVIRFQTSNPASIGFRVGGRPEILVSESPQAFDFKGNQTLVWPPEAIDITDKNFPVGDALPAMKSTISSDSTPAVE
jgi:cytoskeleton protein RodZ